MFFYLAPGRFRQVASKHIHFCVDRGIEEYQDIPEAIVAPVSPCGLPQVILPFGLLSDISMRQLDCHLVYDHGISTTPYEIYMMIHMDLFHYINTGHYITQGTVLPKIYRVQFLPNIQKLPTQEVGTQMDPLIDKLVLIITFLGIISVCMRIL